MRAVAKTVVSANSNACVASVREPYLQAMMLVERLHRRLLEVIKDVFDRRGRTDVNPIQALIVYNLGDQELSIGEYNLKKLVQIGLVEHHRSNHDQRSVRIKLIAKGQEFCQIVEALCQKHVDRVEAVGGIQADEIAILNKQLHRLERFWTDQIVYRL